MSDSFTEVTTKSWGTRLGESIKGVLFGLVLIVGSCVFLFWNEGRAVQTQRSLTEGASLVVSVDPARVDPANDGKLVHLSGDLKPGAPLTDPDFTVSATALRLVRTVEMYQWKEETKTETRKNVGGSEETVTTYEYVRTWSDSRIDSSRFKRPEGHVNPQMRYRGASYSSRDATLGAFRPGTNVIDRLPAERARAARSVAGGEAGGPRQGPGPRCRWAHLSRREPVARRASATCGSASSWRRPGPTSIIGRQAGTGFAEYQTQAGDRLLMVRPGTHVRRRHVRRRAAREPHPDLDFAVRRRVGDVHRLHADPRPAGGGRRRGAVHRQHPVGRRRRSSRWC